MLAATLYLAVNVMEISDCDNLFRQSKEHYKGFYVTKIDYAMCKEGLGITIDAPVVYNSNEALPFSLV